MAYNELSLCNETKTTTSALFAIYRLRTNAESLVWRGVLQTEITSILPDSIYASYSLGSFLYGARAKTIWMRHVPLSRKCSTSRSS